MLIRATRVSGLFSGRRYLCVRKHCLWSLHVSGRGPQGTTVWLLKLALYRGSPPCFDWYYSSTVYNMRWQICSASFQTQRNGHVPPLSTNTPSSTLPPLRNENALPPLRGASVPPPSYGEVVAPPVYQNMPSIGTLPPLPQPTAPPADE